MKIYEYFQENRRRCSPLREYLEATVVSPMDMIRYEVIDISNVILDVDRVSVDTLIREGEDITQEVRFYREKYKKYFVVCCAGPRGMPDTHTTVDAIDRTITLILLVIKPFQSLRAFIAETLPSAENVATEYIVNVSGRITKVAAFGTENVTKRAEIAKLCVENIQQAGPLCYQELIVMQSTKIKTTYTVMSTDKMKGGKLNDVHATYVLMVTPKSEEDIENAKLRGEVSDDE